MVRFSVVVFGAVLIASFIGVRGVGAGEPFCEVVIDSGKIHTTEGDLATFSGFAKGSSTGEVIVGWQQYQDHGPLSPIRIFDGHPLGVLCDGNTAFITGVPDETPGRGAGGVDYFINVVDNGEPGRGADTYMIQIDIDDTTYFSGLQTLEGGDIRITLT